MSESFMQRAAAASKALTMALALPAATWEPHDWSTFPLSDAERCVSLCCDLLAHHKPGAPGCCQEAS